ncbi:hypothetical protein Tcan_11734 [Toxocara canis]|uniref:Uncharacterized protein n=1 Tax=Toxocara canis TaxID=6265 RepID=A0A0B2UXB8_TOXCA|nr:hypothetical protein Tcan_11734 [Toxocara canis]
MLADLLLAFFISSLGGCILALFGMFAWYIHENGLHKFDCTGTHRSSMIVRESLVNARSGFNDISAWSLIIGFSIYQSTCLFATY